MNDSNEDSLLEQSETLVNRLLKLIGEKSVTSFAKECGFSEALLRKYLKGTQPGAENLVLISKATGCSLDWLLLGVGPIFINNQPNLELEDDESKDDILWIIRIFKSANSDQKNALKALMKAIENPAGLAWFRVGESITKIANFFPKRK